MIESQSKILKRLENYFTKCKLESNSAMMPTATPGVHEQCATHCVIGRAVSCGCSRRGILPSS
jgi:hypothetical protein